MVMCSRDQGFVLEHTKYYSHHFSQSIHLKPGKYIMVDRGTPFYAALLFYLNYSNYSNLV